MFSRKSIDMEDMVYSMEALYQGRVAGRDPNVDTGGETWWRGTAMGSVSEGADDMDSIQLESKASIKVA